MAGHRQGELPPNRAALRAQVDLETIERWIRLLGKEPRHYPYLEDWQAMLARGDAEEDEAQELADAFQRLFLKVVAEQSELEERNRRIIAKGTPLAEVKSTPMPNGFESFFDRHQLEIETLERERLNLYTDEGIDHEKLIYRYSGRDYRLTDVHGRVVHDILA